MRRPPGRPPGTGKPAEELYVRRTYTLPPRLWVEVERYIPPGERSALIQRAFEEAIRQRRDGLSGPGQERGDTMDEERLQELKRMAELSRQCLALRVPGQGETLAAREPAMEAAHIVLHAHPEAIVLELVAEVERLRAALGLLKGGRAG